MSTPRIARWRLLASSLLTIAILAPGAASQSQQPTQNAPPGTAVQPSRAEVVWVNTTSGYYHHPSSRHYGKTKHGKYMPEPDAVRAGYRAARN